MVLSILRKGLNTTMMRQNDRVKVVGNTTNHPFFEGERVYVVECLQDRYMYEGKPFCHVEGKKERRGDVLQNELEEIK